MTHYRPRIVKLALKDFKRDGYARQPSSVNGWDEARKNRLALDEFSCYHCSAKSGLEVHHVIPRSKGGSNALCNLLTLCHSCHDKMHSHKLKHKRR